MTESEKDLETSPYDFKIWNLIIRPPRVAYDESELGPSEFVAGGVRASRRDFQLRTSRGALLACSYFAPTAPGRCPVVVYLHGNSSSRLEAMQLVGALLSQRLALFCFDAAGCGRSSGDYVSLGWHERDDLQAVLAYVRSLPGCTGVGLWGRSMGAATALMHASRDKELAALCLDSSYASLPQLMEEFGRSKHIPMAVPSWLLAPAFALVRMRVRALAGFDTEDLVPLAHAARSAAPAVFLHGLRDDFIPFSHTRQLYEAYGGQKELITVEADHNGERGGEVVRHVIAFFKRCLRPEKQLVPVLRCDPQFAVPCLDGVPFRVPLRRRQSTDLRRKDQMAKTEASGGRLSAAGRQARLCGGA